MTDIEPIVTKYGTTTVAESVDEWGKPTLKITDPKIKAFYTVYKPIDGFSFFRVRLSKGAVPNELSGSYTKLGLAREAVVKYLEKMKESKTARRDRVYKENH